MDQPEMLSAILERIAKGEDTKADLQRLQDLLNQGDRLPSVLQIGKYPVNIQQALGPIHIGDRTTLSDEQIQAIAQAIREQLTPSLPSATEELPAIDELVQQVRSRLHDDIQRLHGTMPLWGVDHWVPLGELFVDVNILEEVSSNQRSELADLVQDFNRNPDHRGLDRIGLGEKRQRVSGLAVLARNTNLMVVGKPGSGKTTYLQRVVTECNAGNLQAHRIPMLIRLREFVEDGRRVDYAVERYLERCWRLSAVEVQWVLEAGRSLVLLDGLDEVTGADGQAISKQIKRFARDYPQVQVIVTCRTQSQESRFERFDSVEVADFNKSQVRAFAEHWFQTVCGDLTVGQAKATAFLEQLFREENKPIRELAITPILLSLTCAVFQQKQAFYSKRSKLYEEGLELLLEQWDRSREIERDEVYRDLSVERKLELLSYLAVKKFEQEQYVLFEQAEIEGYIVEFLGIGVRESRGVLRAIEAQHGLLIERSQKVWSFSHLTFQEYLVAKWFCDEEHKNIGIDFWEKIKEQTFEKHWESRYWHEVLILISGIINDEYVGEAVDFLVRLDGGHASYLNLFLAANCLSEVKHRAKLEEISNELFKRLKQLIRYIDEQADLNFEEYQFFFKIYGQAFEVISKTWRDQETLCWLKSCIHSKENNRNEYMGGYFAIQELAKWWRNDPDTLPMIKQCARQHISNSQNLQESALQELSNYWEDDPEALYILKECTQLSENFRVRWVAIKGLSRVWDDKFAMFNFFYQVARNDCFKRQHSSQRNPRKAALEVIVEKFSAHPKTRELLLFCSQHDEDDQVRDFCQNRINSLNPAH